MCRLRRHSYVIPLQLSLGVMQRRALSTEKDRMRDGSVPVVRAVRLGQSTVLAFFGLALFSCASRLKESNPEIRPGHTASGDSLPCPPPGGERDAAGRQFFRVSDITLQTIKDPKSPGPEPAGAFGTVILRMIIDTTGRPEPGLEVVRSDDPRLEVAVRQALPRMRFLPAEHPKGCRVRQLTDQPFAFERGS